MKAIEIEAWINQVLTPENYRDYGPNGLQLANSARPITKLALAVSASLEAIEKAAQAQADAILVHHGIFWDGQRQTIQGPQYHKIQRLIEADMALFAYHLPLDNHPLLGNNAQLALKLGLKDQRQILSEGGQFSGVMAQAGGITPQELQEKAKQLLNRQPLLLEFGTQDIQQVAIVTGGGQKYFEQALAEGADAFITGESSEFNYGQAQEHRANFLACGHYATERFGVQALGEQLSRETGIEHQFIDCENPI